MHAVRATGLAPGDSNGSAGLLSFDHLCHRNKRNPFYTDSNKSIILLVDPFVLVEVGNKVRLLRRLPFVSMFDSLTLSITTLQRTRTLACAKTLEPKSVFFPPLLLHAFSSFEYPSNHHAQTTKLTPFQLGFRIGIARQ